MDTEEKAAAYAAILDFLDNLEELPFPPELEESLRTACEKLTEASLAQADAAMEAALAEPDRYLSENQEAIRNYLAYRSSPGLPPFPRGGPAPATSRLSAGVGYEGFCVIWSVSAPPTELTGSASLWRTSPSAASFRKRRRCSTRNRRPCPLPGMRRMAETFQAVTIGMDCAIIFREIKAPHQAGGKRPAADGTEAFLPPAAPWRHTL